MVAPIYRVSCLFPIQWNNFPHPPPPRPAVEYRTSGSSVRCTAFIIDKLVITSGMSYIEAEQEMEHVLIPIRFSQLVHIKLDYEAKETVLGSIRKIISILNIHRLGSSSEGRRESGEGYISRNRAVRISSPTESQSGGSSSIHSLSHL